MDICNFCGNKNFNQITTQYTYKRDGNSMIIEDVPCEQCEYCGEQYFEAKILKKIESEFNAIYSNKKLATRTVTIPVESYAALAIA